MLVNEYMSNSPVTVRDDADYKSAFELMDKGGLHHLPVMNASEEMVGILALRDLQFAARYFKEAPVEMCEIMHTPVMTVATGSLLSGAASLMREHRIGCLPVIDGDNHVEGMLTETDLFRALGELLEKDD